MHKISKELFESAADVITGIPFVGGTAKIINKIGNNIGKGDINAIAREITQAMDKSNMTQSQLNIIYNRLMDKLSRLKLNYASKTLAVKQNSNPTKQKVELENQIRDVQSKMNAESLRTNALTAAQSTLSQAKAGNISVNELGRTWDALNKVTSSQQKEEIK